MCTDLNNAAIIGGSVSGLAAAHKLNQSQIFGQITIFERQKYENKRVDCGEAINDTKLVPLEKTRENGFVNNLEGYELRVYSGLDRDPNGAPIGKSKLPCDPGYICERDTVERRWAVNLESEGVEFETDRSVSPSQYQKIIEDYDYVIDASGQPSLSLKTRDKRHEYTGDMVALNATVEGDFSDYEKWPRIFFEGFVGYSSSFPKSDSSANIGIGWAGDHRPDDYMASLADTAKRNGFPMPNREAVNIYTIPRGPSLDPSKVYFPEDNVFLVGDATGVANRYQGEGICQGIR